MSLTDRIMKIDRTDPAYISALIEKKPRRGDPKEIEIVKKIGETVLREEWAKGAFSEISLIQKDYLKEMIANAGNQELIHRQTQDVLAEISKLLRSEIVESEENLAKLSARQPVLVTTNHFGSYKLAWTKTKRRFRRGYPRLRLDLSFSHVFCSS